MHTAFVSPNPQVRAIVILRESLKDSSRNHEGI